MKKYILKINMHFPHIFLFTSVTSKSSIDINAISIFNNQPCRTKRHDNYKNTIICKQCGMFHSLSSQGQFSSIRIEIGFCSQ